VPGLRSQPPGNIKDRLLSQELAEQNGTERYVAFHHNRAFAIKMTLKNIMLVLAFATCAMAHMTVTPAEIKAAGRATFSVAIAHDCGDDTSGTSNFTLVIPDGLYAVTVEQDAMWYTIIDKIHLSPPVTIGSTTYNETVRSIQFQGFLPDGYYKIYGIKAQAAMLPNGTTLYWKGYQECHGRGKPLAWDQLPTTDNPKPRYPAVPLVVIGDSESPTSPTHMTSPASPIVAGTGTSTHGNHSHSGGGLHLHLHGPPKLYAMYKSLRDGGHVIFLCHAKTNVLDKDMNANDSAIATTPCSMQRNLSPFGIEASKEMSMSWKILKIPVSKVHTSLYCRTRHTAQLAFGPLSADIHDDFDLVPTDDAIPLLGKRLKAAFSMAPAAGTNTALVGHVLSINSYDGSYIEEGECIVARPTGLSFEEVGRITMTQWGDLTRDYLAHGEMVFEMAAGSHTGHSDPTGPATISTTVVSGAVTTGAPAAGAPTADPHAGHGR
jgi:uncharacterized protein YcnI